MLLPPTSPLGQTTGPDPGEILGLLAWIVVLAAVTVAVAFVLRLWLRDRGDGADATIGTGFTLADLRALRDRGELDEAEYAAARERLIGPGTGTGSGAGAGASAVAEPGATPRPAAPGAAAPGAAPADGGIVWDDPDLDPDPEHGSDDPPLR